MLVNFVFCETLFDISNGDIIDELLTRIVVRKLTALEVTNNKSLISMFSNFLEPTNVI